MSDGGHRQQENDQVKAKSGLKPWIGRLARPGIALEAPPSCFATIDATSAVANSHVQSIVSVVWHTTTEPQNETHRMTMMLAPQTATQSGGQAYERQ